LVTYYGGCGMCDPIVGVGRRPRGQVPSRPGLPAPDHCLGFSWIDTCRYMNGRIAEYWSETADLMEQLGITVP
jgi:hypothetical protein